MEALVRNYRGGVENLCYTGHIAVTDGEGNIRYHAGDPHRIAFARSSAKPMQAVCVFETGAKEHYQLETHEVSMLTASHSGEEYHLETVRSILRKAGLDESYLHCGSHYPFYQPDADAMKARGEHPTEVHCNCSGKHAGMLITAKHRGESLDDYYRREHPVQRRIVSTIAEICGYPEEEILLATDGCGVPVHAMPLCVFARGYARLCHPGNFFSDRRATAVEEITHAMRAYPKYMSGTGRLCAKLMEHLGDRLFAKSGADGYYTVGLLSEGLGIAVKLDNAPNAIRDMVVVETLRQLGILQPHELSLFEEELIQPIYNHKGETVGMTRPVFTLRRL